MKIRTPILSILSFLLLGCEKQQLITPQSGAVTGGISRVQSGVTKAQAEQAEIARQNAAARALAARADNKDIFLDSYRKWKAQHP